MVQSELHPKDAGSQGNGNSSESGSDQTASRSLEPLASRDTSQVTEKSPQTPDETLSRVASAQSKDPEWLEQNHPDKRTAFLHRAGEEIVAWVKTFASAAVYATLIVTFGFQVARVEGRSMEPTLQDQDRLIVNKAMYRFFREPQPGDIVMLYYPRDPDKSFVKRIVAQEGDTVRIENGKVYVNEILQPDLYVPPEFRSHENHGPEVVQESYYFVMGDHRNNSSDSRHWGQVPKKYIIGKVQLRWWPLTDATLF